MENNTADAFTEYFVGCLATQNKLSVSSYDILRNNHIVPFMCANSNLRIAPFMNECIQQPTAVCMYPTCIQQHTPRQDGARASQGQDDPE